MLETSELGQEAVDDDRELDLVEIHLFGGYQAQQQVKGPVIDIEMNVVSHGQRLLPAQRKTTHGTSVVRARLLAPRWVRPGWRGSGAGAGWRLSQTAASGRRGESLSAMRLPDPGRRR